MNAMQPFPALTWRAIVRPGPLLLATLSLGLVLVRPGGAATLSTLNQSVTAPNGTALAIPVQADFAAGEHVLSLQLELDFPNNWLVTGISTTGTLLESWGASVDFNASGDGLELAAAAAADMAGSGVLFHALVEIQGSGTLAIPQALLNQGSPVPVISQGYFTHTLPPAINVSPTAAANLLPGETVQYVASGSPAPVPPLSWSVEDPLSGQISAGGLFTALAQGANRVQVTDAGGRSGTGPAIQVYTYHLQPAALAGMAGQSLPLALTLQNPTAAPFHSLSFTLNLGSPRLSVTGLLQAGSLTEGWPELSYTQQGNLVTVAGVAPPEGVNGAGLLLSLQVASSAGTAFNSTLTLSDVRLDENWLTRTATAACQLTATNSFTLTPATATLLRGQTQQINVNGTPNGPLTWTSLDPAVCSVSAAGLVTALAGGDARLMALDPLGVGDTTSFYHVNDLIVAPASLTAPPGQLVLVPLTTGDPSSYSVTSWQLRLAYPTTWLTFDGFETAGSLCQGWSELSWTQQAGVIEAAGAGPALDQAGTQLVFLRFQVAANAAGSATLTLQDFLYNEGLPTVQRGNGLITFGALPPACAVNPASLDFGTTLPNTPVTRTFTISNTGGGTLSGTVSESCAEFSIVSGAAYSLTAGQSQTVTVQFQSATSGTFNCTLDTGGACADLACTALVEASPACAVTPASLDFGTVLPGTPVIRSFTISNTGGGTLSGTVSESCAEFSIVSGAAYSLTAGQSQTVTVQFQSAAAGSYNCTLDTGGACADLPAVGAALAIAVTTGPESVCGVVDVLGHLPGAISGFLVDWNAGLVGLAISPAPLAGVTASILIDGVAQYTGPAAADWQAGGHLDLVPWLAQDIVLHLEVSDGINSWNSAGALCLWDLTFADLEPGRPAAFRLEEPAPNPFNPATTLRWSLPTAGATRLALYDLQGRLVRVLLEGAQPAGEHVLRLEAGGLASGLYLLRLESEGRVDTRRLLLLK